MVGENISPQRRRGNEICAEIRLATFYFYFNEISQRPSFFFSPPFQRWVKKIIILITHHFIIAHRFNGERKNY